MDQFDDATVREEQFRENALQAARSHAEEHPIIECDQFHNATQKGLECAFYADCLQDWTRADSAKRRNGKHGHQ